MMSLMSLGFFLNNTGKCKFTDVSSYSDFVRIQRKIFFAEPY